MADAYSTCEARFNGFLVLEAAGTFVDTVIQIEPLFGMHSSDEDTITALKNIISFSDAHEPYITGENLLEAYCRIFYLNDFPDRYIPVVENDWTPKLSKEALSEIVSLQSPHSALLSVNGAIYLSNLKRYLEGWSFVRTQKGYYGVIPRSAKVGDHVCAILGCRSLMLLRPKGNDYQVVGECYVQGLMFGEALLGPLLGGWRMVLSLSKTVRGYFWTYVCDQTGKFRITDPRFRESLPAEWRIQTHDHREWFVNKETGEEVDHDPRLTASELSRRGVDIKTFRLV